MKENEYGRSMIEMLGVLAVIGVLSVGGFDLVTKANNSRKTAAVIDEIGSLANKARIVMRDYQPGDEVTEEETEEEEGEGEGGGEGEGMEDPLSGMRDVTGYIHKGRAYPDILKYEGNSFVGTEDAEYKIYYSGNDAVLFILEARGLSTDMCMQIATIDWGSRSTNGFLGMDVNVSSPTALNNILSASTITPNSSTGIPGSSSHPVPMGVGKATTLCDEDGDITIHFAFK